MTETLVQILIGGLTIGCIYSLIALGFTLMLRATEVVNFAQGEMVMIGALVGYTVITHFPLPLWAVFVLGTGAAGLVGLIAERLAFRRILERKSPVLNLIIASLGLSIALKAIAILIWGGYPLNYPRTIGAPMQLHGIVIHSQNLWILGLALAAMASLQFFFYRTLTGISWRAASLDASTVQLMGVSVRRTVALTFALTSALGGAAGVLVAPIHFASFGMGEIAIKAFAAAAMGGFTVIGTVIGGLVLGMLETLAAGLLTTAYKDVVAFGLMIVILFLFRPKALEGRTIEERVRAIARSQPLRLPRALRVTGVVVGLAILATVPQWANEYLIRVLNLALIYVMAAIGLQLIIGFTGQISLGHAAFMGVGAYTSALLALRLGLPFGVGAAAAMVAAAGIGWLISPVLRLSGHFLAIATLALNEIVVLLMINLTPITNGAYGLMNIPLPGLAGLQVRSDVDFYYLAAGSTVLLYLVVRAVTRSRFGQTIMGIRENELAAVSCGIDVARYRRVSFMLGTACAGLAGAYYAHFMSYISPESFTLTSSLNMLIMVVIGGLGSLPGAVLGGFLVTLAPEYLRAFSEFRLVIYGMALMTFMAFLPNGLVDLLRRPLGQGLSLRAIKPVFSSAPDREIAREPGSKV